MKIQTYYFAVEMSFVIRFTVLIPLPPPPLSTSAVAIDPLLDNDRVEIQKLHKTGLKPLSALANTGKKDSIVPNVFKIRDFHIFKVKACNTAYIFNLNQIYFPALPIVLCPAAFNLGSDISNFYQLIYAPASKISLLYHCR